MCPKRFVRLFPVPLLLVGCGIAESPTKEVIIPLVTPDLTLEIVSGDQQSQRVGKALSDPLAVKVRDQAGRPWSDQSVRFEVASGDLVLHGGEVVTTDADGLASVRVQLGASPGPFVVSALLLVAASDETKHRIEFSGNALAVPPPKLQIHDSLSNGQVGTVGTVLPVPLTVVARDSDGNGVAGETIQYTVVAGSPSVAIESSVLTNAEGVASASLALGTVSGPIEIRATWLPDPDGLADRSVTFHAVANPGAPALLTFVSGHMNGSSPACTGESQAFTENLIVRLTDAFGNPISGQSLRIQPDSRSSIAGGGGAGIPVVSSTGSSGEVSFGVIAGATPASSYSEMTAIAVSVVSAASGAPSISTPLRFTKHLYLEMGEGSAVWNYGMTGIFPMPVLFLGYLDYPVKLWLRGTCWAPIAGKTIKGMASVKYNTETDTCPANVSSWPDESEFWTATTGTDGYASTTVRASVLTLINVRKVATRGRYWGITDSGNTNTLYSYGGHTDCPH
jgi:hypothetical protein